MSRQTIYILIFSLLTVLLWIGLEAYHRQLDLTIPEGKAVGSVSFTADLDLTIVPELEKRELNRVEEQLPY